MSQQNNRVDTLLHTLGGVLNYFHSSRIINVSVNDFYIINWDASGIHMWIINSYYLIISHNLELIGEFRMLHNVNARRTPVWRKIVYKNKGDDRFCHILGLIPMKVRYMQHE